MSSNTKAVFLNESSESFNESSHIIEPGWDLPHTKSVLTRLKWVLDVQYVLQMSERLRIFFLRLFYITFELSLFMSFSWLSQITFIFSFRFSGNETPSGVERFFEDKKLKFASTSNKKKKALLFVNDRIHKWIIIQISRNLLSSYFWNLLRNLSIWLLNSFSIFFSILCGMGKSAMYPNLIFMGEGILYPYAPAPPSVSRSLDTPPSPYWKITWFESRPGLNIFCNSREKRRLQKSRYGWSVSIEPIIVCSKNAAFYMNINGRLRAGSG